MLIYLNCTDLLLGYRRVKRARAYMLAKWRHDLLRAYAARRDHYHRELARFNERKSLYLRRTLPLILLALAVVYFAGIWLALQGIYLGGLLILAAIFLPFPAAGYWLFYPGRPAPPEHPLLQSKRQGYTSPVKERLFTDLHPLWRQGLAAHILTYEQAEQKAEKTLKWGLIGEYGLIRELDLVTGPETLILHSVMPKRNDDLDVVVIGPKGIWYFEVKYINARFEWCEGTWTVWKYDHESRLERPEPMTEYPDAQWKRMRKELLAVLDARSPTIAEIQGGIVFAHADARYDIQGPAPFRFGTIPEWIRAYVQAPILRGMSPEVVLHFAETLLKRHQELNPAMKLYSMNYYLSDLIGKEEQRIRKWIEESKPVAR